MSDNNLTLQQRRIVETLELFPENVASVLDVGCGRGKLSDALHERFRRVVSVDLNFERLLGLKNACCQADLFDLPFADGCFDLVLCSEVLEHLEEKAQESALSEIARVASRYLFVSVPWQQKIVPGLVRCPDCGSVFHVSGHIREFFQETDIPAPSGFKKSSFKPIVSMPRAPQMVGLARLEHRLGSYFAPASPPVYCPSCRSYVTADSSAPLAGRVVRSIMWRTSGFIQRLRPVVDAGWAAWLFERNQKTPDQSC